MTYNLVHRKEGASLEETLTRIIKAGRLEERNLNKKIILEKAQLFFDKNSSSNPDNLISIFKDSVVPTSSTFKELIRSYESKWEYRKKEALLNGMDPLPYICTVTFLKIMDAHSWGKYKTTRQGLNVYTYSSFEDVSLLKGRDVSTFQELEKAQGVFRTFLQEGDNLLITDFGRDFVPEEYKKTCDEY